MAKINTFEDIASWKKARQLAKNIYDATSMGGFATDFGLRNQIRRAAVSVLSNIAEGFERGGDREFLQFLSAAKGSCGELRAQLYVAADQKYISQAEFDVLRDRASEVSQLISGFMKYLKQSDMRGNKLR